MYCRKPPRARSRIPIEWIDAERRGAARGLRGERVVAAEEAVFESIERRRVVPVEELRLRVGLQRVLKATRQVQVGERHRPVLRHGGGVQVELLVAEDVCECHLRAAEQIAAARHAEVHRWPAFQEELFERALLPHVLADQRVRERRHEVDNRAGRSETLAGDGVQRFLTRERVDLVLSLVVRDEGNLSGFPSCSTMGDTLPVSVSVYCRSSPVFRLSVQML